MTDYLNDNNAKKKPMFSIVTPSFNSWRLMNKYWETLEKQTYRNFEVIIVDDNSNDDTYESILEYKNNSNLNIKLLKNYENHGPGYSRNRGMNAAAGEWITFVDSDDSIDICLLQKVVEIIKTNNRAAVPINCVVFDYKIIKSNKEIYGSSMYGNHRGGVHPISECIAMVRNHVVCKFYKYERIKTVSFPEIKKCEDVAFVCRAIEASCINEEEEIGCIYYLKEALYNYYQRGDSLSNDIKIDETDMIKAYQILKDTLGAKYKKEIQTKTIADLLYGCILVMCKVGKSDFEINRHIDRFEEQYPNWYKNIIVKKMGRAKWIYLTNIKLRNIKMLRIMAYVHSKLIV